MKLKLISLVLFFFYFNTYSQLNSSIYEYGISFDNLSKFVDSKTNDNNNELIDIKASHWDNQVFNPYKEEIIKFPFKITFDDSIYHSPILKDKVITSRYGWRWRRAHKGIDIDLIKGDKVLAVFDGIVRLAKYHSGHGNLVIVRHYNGLETAYAHLSKISVKANDTVTAGQLLGKGGATGNARGSHLHFITSYHGIAINPEYLFDFSKTNKIRAKEIWVTKKWTRPYLHSSRRKTKLELLSSKDEALASLEKEKKIYVVKKGDTLSRISSRNGVSIRSICIANNIRSNSLLRIGQKLYID